MFKWQGTSTRATISIFFFLSLFFPSLCELFCPKIFLPFMECKLLSCSNFIWMGYLNVIMHQSQAAPWAHSLAYDLFYCFLCIGPRNYYCFYFNWFSLGMDFSIVWVRPIVDFLWRIANKCDHVEMAYI